MNTTLKPELYWLVLTVMLTALIWVPYILNRLREHPEGAWAAVWNPQPDTRPKAHWAERLMRAHSNAVENLAIFAPLVLALLVAEVATAETAIACMVYFFARLAHVFLYTFKIPLLRTLAFFVGFLCQMTLALTLLRII